MTAVRNVACSGCCRGMSCPKLTSHAGGEFKGGGARRFRLGGARRNYCHEHLIASDCSWHASNGRAGAFQGADELAETRASRSTEVNVVRFEACQDATDWVR